MCAFDLAFHYGQCACHVSIIDGRFLHERIINRNEADPVLLKINRAVITIKIIKHVRIGYLSFVFHETECLSVLFQRFPDTLLQGLIRLQGCLLLHRLQFAGYCCHGLRQTRFMLKK